MSPRPVTYLPAVFAVVLAIVSCDAAPMNPIFGGLGASGGSSIIVFGFATAATGAPVVAALRVIAQDSTCTGASLGEKDVTTTSTGAYRIVLTSAKSVQPMCVTVTGKITGTADTTTAQPAVVTFGPGDSTQVNIPFP